MSRKPRRSKPKPIRRRALRAPKTILSFFSDWWLTRHWSSLARSVPAIVAGLAVWGLCAIHANVTPAGWIGKYEAAGQAALGRSDLQAAEVCFRRLADLDEGSVAALYGLALIAERRQDVPRARELLQQIAPDSRPGHPDAHYWLARDMVARQLPADPQTRTLLEHHLLQAKRSPAHEMDARVILARLYNATGRSQDAIQELEQAGAAKPESQLELARLYTLAGRLAESHRAATRAAAYFRARTLAEPGQLETRLNLASSYVLQQNYEEASKVLEEGLTRPDLQPFQQALEQALAATYLRWFDVLTAQDKAGHAEPSPTGHLQKLEKALRHDPNNERALAVLAELMLSRQGTAEQAEVILERILADGEVPVIIDLALGTRALTEGDFDEGLKHLQQAQQRNDRVPEVLNNLAWGLAHKDPPELERALDLATAAQKLSNRPEICDTLGTILARLGKPREAVTQLEAALRGLPPRADLHRKLAELYKQLGDAGMADEHRRQADQLDNAP